MDDGTKCKPISEWSWHVLYFHIGVIGARPAAPLQYSLRWCHFLCEIWQVGWLNMALYEFRGDQIKLGRFGFEEETGNEHLLPMQLLFFLHNLWLNLRIELVVKLQEGRKLYFLRYVTLSTKNEGVCARKATSHSHNRSLRRVPSFTTTTQWHFSPQSADELLN